jgi:hypothetical protein
MSYQQVYLGDHERRDKPKKIGEYFRACKCLSTEAIIPIGYLIAEQVG